MDIEIKILDKDLYTEYGIPNYATPGSCAIDLRSTQDMVVHPGDRCKINTGVSIWLGSKCKSCKDKFMKHGVAALIMPRSGLGTKGLILANTIGLIDEDYQGELVVSAWNSNANTDKMSYNDVKRLVTNGILTSEHLITLGVSGDLSITVQRGDRIAQLMFTPIVRPRLIVVDEYSRNTGRSDGGFGSTGGK